MTDKSLEERIDELAQQIAEFVPASAERKIKEQLEKLKKDGLIETYEGDKDRKEETNG